MIETERPPLPLRPQGHPCPADPDHGPLTLGQDGLWHCYSAWHDGYPDAHSRAGVAGMSTLIHGRAGTRSTWTAEELLA